MKTIATTRSTAARRRAQIRALLPAMLGRRLGGSDRIRGAEIRPSAFRSSFALEEIDVLLESGETLRLILKDVGSSGLLDSARLAKPAFLYDPVREIDFYREVLAQTPHLGTAELFGAVVEPRKDRYWLLLERVPGLELYQIGDLEVWRAVARWLATMHADLRALAGPVPRPGVTRALRYEADFLRRWMTRAHSFVCSGRTDVRPERRRRMDHLASRYERVVERLMALPATAIHGEFYPSNILVRTDGPTSRICPIDWEMMSIGPGLIDVAALVGGRWTEAQRRDLALTYGAALDGIGQVADEAAFMEAVAYCRLHLAVQWIGWSPDWSPPPDHVHDWLNEALSLADSLDL